MAYWISKFKKEFELLEPDRTVLVVIDMQNASACRTEGVGRLLAEKGESAIADWRFRRIEQVVLPKLIQLLAFFRRHKLKLVHVAWGSREEDYSDIPIPLREAARIIGNQVGSQVNEFLPEMKPEAGEPVVRKTTTSPFMSSSLDQVLRKMNAKYLIFAGISTNYCVDLAARNAADLGYLCTIVEDCCAGVSEELHEWALNNFAALPGMVRNTDSVIRELTEHL